MAVNGFDQYYWGASQQKAKGVAGGYGKNAVNDNSAEEKKNMALAKANDLDYGLIKKGQLYEAREKNTDGPVKFDPKKNEDYDKAIAEWNKFKEVKSASEQNNTTAAAGETAEAAVTQKAETYKPDMDKIRAMKADLKNNIGSFKQMVYAMFKGQSGFASDAMKSLLDIDEASQAKAQAAIADDGEWGVDATANRILDFAKALSGGDPDKIETLRDAVMKGFKAAEKVWGGELPGISQQTLKKVMEGFDEWAKSGVAATATVEE